MPLPAFDSTPQLRKMRPPRPSYRMRPQGPRPFALFLALLCSTCAAGALAAGAPTFALTITDHAFSPATLQIPAGTRVELQVRNQRRLPSEFESYELNREKIVPPGGSITVWIGPMPAGRYKIFDDFNPSTIGWVVASAGVPK